MYMPSIFKESLFDDFFEDFARPMRKIGGLPQFTSTQMRTDVKERDGGYELHIELPGYKKEDVKAELKHQQRMKTMRRMLKRSIFAERGIMDRAADAFTLEMPLSRRISKQSLRMVS